MKKTTKFLLLTLLFVTLFFSLFFSFLSPQSIEEKYIEHYKSNIIDIQYPEFLKNIEENKIKTVYFSNAEEIFYIKTENGFNEVINPEYDTFKKEILEKSIEIKQITEVNDEILLLVKNKLLIFRIVLLVLSCISLYIAKIFFVKYLKFKKEGMKRDLDKVEAFINSISPQSAPQPPKPVKPKKQTFDDVAGLVEVKKDVGSLVDFLKNKDKYTAAGATLPKGVIFYGPPGTGKTLLARAIAGEANIPFHYMSGSDFVEMYVGVGAKRVRELFAEAKKKTPCIVFIDEIDAIGGKRSREDANGEDKKTLNALLTEMDGFKSSDSIIVIGATNRIEDLDPALVRPGRFSNKYCIPLPCSAKERLEVITLYSKGKKFSDDVSFDALSKETIGFSPAAIESLLNEAAIISVQDKKDCIDKEVLDKAMIKTILSGHIKENQEDRNKEELRIVSWHEAGHALMGKLNGKEIPKVTILSSTTGAGGVTFTTPKEETGIYSIEDLKNEVKELYAGRIAETLMPYGPKLTTGASNDIEKATSIIKSIVTSYGMSEEYGMLNLNMLKVNQDTIIEKEVKLAKDIEKDTRELLISNFASLERIATALLENETLYDSDLVSLMQETNNTVAEE